jgi:ribonucleoside-diphosphate reductase alpha chain
MTDISLEAGTWGSIFTASGLHPFDTIKWKRCDASIKSSKGVVVFEQNDIEVPEFWNQTTINIVADKYFRVIDGVRENSVKQMFSRVARQLRTWGEAQNFFQTELDASTYELELLFALVHQYGAFNSPVWFNLGVPGRRQAASACFISSVDDSLESIFEFQKSESTIFAGGSGSGANLSKIRSSYEKLSSGSYTSGPLSWMRGLDQYAMAMKSGGSTRNAAKMVVLDMDHPDILETKDGRPGFIRSKAVEEKLAHDMVDAGYSAAYDDPNGAYKRVMYQNANHSVSISDEFMEAVENDGNWSTKSRKDGSVVSTYKAREVWDEIAKAAWICGDPGVQFTDTINSWHTTPNAGRINASNPCSEFLHVDDTACNLAAINLTKFFDDGEFKYDRFAQAVRVFSTSQMIIVDKADYPTAAIEKNSKLLRPIGLNYGDLGALIMEMGYSYDSDEGRNIAARLASLMTGLGYLNSAKIAARLGAFPLYQDNREAMLDIMKRHQKADKKVKKAFASDEAAKVWKEVVDLGAEHGFYTSQMSLQAPLGTISFLMGMNTTGIEPAFSLVSYKSMVGGGFMKLTNSSVPNALRSLGYSEATIKSICEHIEKTDSIEGAPGFKHTDIPVFDCAMPSGPSGRYLSPLAHIKMMAAIQPLITCAQSKTVNMPNTATPQDIADVYYQSWKLGIKCVALYRDGCKASQPLSAKKEEKKEASSDLPLVSTPNREKLPDDIKATRHKFTIDGFSGYITVGEYADGRPGEVFLKLGKPGSTISGLINGYTQLLSLALQYGIPLPKLIESFIDTKFEPAGMTSNKQIRFTKSLYDYLFKYLDIKYFKGEHSGLGERLGLVDKEEVASTTHKEPAKKVMGPPCTKCGGLTQRAGACWICGTCGTSSGCS